MMETDFMTSLPTTDLGTDPQQLPPRPPPPRVQPLNKYLPIGKMQYDTTVPVNLFSDGENSDDDDSLLLDVGGPGDFPNIPTSTTDSLFHVDANGTVSVDLSSLTTRTRTGSAMTGAEALAAMTSVGGSLDSLPVESLFNLNDIPDTDFHLDLDDNIDTALFEDGIAANDMSSLLEQFEEAAATLPDVDVTGDEEDVPVKEESRSAAASPEPQSESEVMRLLKAKNPVSVPKKAVSVPKKGLGAASKNISASKVPSSYQLQPTARSPPTPTQKPAQKSLPKSGPPKGISGKPRNMFFPARPVPPTKTSTKPSKSSKTSKSSNAVHTSKVKTPPPEVLQKIRSSNKRKSTIMLPTAAPPIRSERLRGIPPSAAPSIESRRSQKASAPVQGSAQIKQLLVETGAGSRRSNRNMASCNSAPCSPKMRPHTVGPSSAPVSPVQKTAPSSLLPPKPTMMRNSFSETDVKKLVKPECNYELSSDYFTVIFDHDYCQNSRQPAPAHSSPDSGSPTVQADSTPSTSSSPDVRAEEEDGSVLKSLLLNKNLAAQLKRQAAAERARQVRKVSVNLDVVDMEIEDQEPTPASPCYSRSQDPKAPTGGAHVIGGIAVGLPLPPLPPLDQLPKDCELRQLGSGSDSNDSVRPVNDMNVILNKVKQAMNGTPSGLVVPVPVAIASTIKDEAVSKAVREMKHILNSVSLTPKRPDRPYKIPRLSESARSKPESSRPDSSRPNSSRPDSRPDRNRQTRNNRHERSNTNRHERSQPAHEMNAILNRATLLPPVRKSEHTPEKCENVYQRSENVHQRSENVHHRSENAHQRSENAHHRSENAHQRSENAHQRSENAHHRSEQVHQRSEQVHAVGRPHEESVRQVRDSRLNNVDMVPVAPIKPEPVAAVVLIKREQSPLPMEEAITEAPAPEVHNTQVRSPVVNITQVPAQDVRVIHPPTRVIKISPEPTVDARTVINIVNGQTQVEYLDGSPTTEELTISLKIENSDSSADIDKVSAADLEKVRARIARLVNEHSNSCSPIATSTEETTVPLVETKPTPTVVETNPAPTVAETNPAQTKAKRNYRKRQPSPTKEAGNLFDKMPTYFTALTKTQKPEKSHMESHRALISEVRTYDRDPSPERDVGFSKLPSYLCFTNSTKYDQEDQPIPAIKTKQVTRAEAGAARAEAVASPQLVVDDRLSGTPYTSARSSRSNTPNLVIASRANSVSRPTSRAPSRSSRSSSSSSCGSDSSSREGSHSPSPPRRRSRGRSSVRRQPFRRKRHSYSSSHSSSASQSRSRSRSRLRNRRSFSRSSSRSRSRSRDMQRRGDRIRPSFGHRSRSRSREEDRELKEKIKRKRIEERRIVYVGRIAGDFTRRDLRRQFERFGEIEDVSVHFREHGGDNYGFVTFIYTSDAYSAIEKGNKIKGMENYDLCFGGRREFCKAQYADLDGNMEMDEEMAPVSAKPASVSASMDFDELLRQARTKIKKKPAASTKRDAECH